MFFKIIVWKIHQNKILLSLYYGIWSGSVHHSWYEIGKIKQSWLQVFRACNNTDLVNPLFNKGRVDFMPVVVFCLPFVHVIAQNIWSTTVSWKLPANGHGLAIAVEKGDTIRVGRTSYKSQANLWIVHIQNNNITLFSFILWLHYDEFMDWLF